MISEAELEYLAAGTHAVFCKEVSPEYDYQRARELKLIQLLSMVLLRSAKT